MKKTLNFYVIMVMVSVFGTLGFTSCSNDDDDEPKKDESVVTINKTKDTALLLVTFGSTFEAPHTTYKNMQTQFEEDYASTCDTYFSLTSTTCITRWGAKTGEYLATPDIWLTAIGKAGYKKVLIQSLHVIPGEEYTMLRDYYIKSFEKAYPNVKVILGKPLLSDRGDYENGSFGSDIKEVGDILYNTYKPKLEKGECIAFLGHGNPEDSYSYANISYRAMESYLKSLNPNIFVATVDCEGMKIEYLKQTIANRKIAQGTIINLTPLMSIAGDHANNDMAGTGDDLDGTSWREILTASGYSIDLKKNCQLKGLGDYPSIVNIWKRHLTEAIEAAK